MDQWAPLRQGVYHEYLAIEPHNDGESPLTKCELRQEYSNQGFDWYGLKKLLLGWSVRLGCLQDLSSTTACLLPSSLIGEFGSFGRSFLPVTRVDNSVGLLLAFMNYTAVDAVFLLAIDDVAALAESAMDLRNGLVESNFCHGLNGLKGFMSFKSFKGVRQRLVFSERGKAATI